MLHDNREVIDTSIDPLCTVQELIDALSRLVPNPDTCYLHVNGDGPLSLAIHVIESTLSDGSKAIDVNIVEA